MEDLMKTLSELENERDYYRQIAERLGQKALADAQDFSHMIRDLRQREIELHQSQVKLEQIIEERTVELVTRNQELSESTLRYDNLVRRIPHGVYTLRVSDTGAMQFEYLSPPLCRILDIDPQEVQRTSGFAFSSAHPADRAQLERATQEASERCISLRWEGRFIIRQEVRWIRLEADPTPTPNGDTIWNGVLSDITEYKLAEEATLNSKKLLQTIINTAPVRIFFKDRELRYIGCNTIFAMDAGLTCPEDLIGKDDYQLAWKEQAELYRADDLGVIESGNLKLSYDEPQTTPDGKKVWLRTSKVPLRNESNEIIGVLGVYEDITEYKQAEVEKARLLLRQRAILDNLPMIAWLKDTESRLEMINEPYAKACGRTIDECIGKTELDLFPEEMARSFMGNDHEVCVSGQKKYVEEMIPFPDGIRWHRTYKTPIYDENGLIIGTAGIAQDITDRKQAEEERARLQEQLTQAQRMESVGQLAGGVAHEFNNMLGVILGHAEMAMDQIDLANPIYGDLEQIRKAAERTAEISRQLLAFARKQNIAPKVLNLNDAVEKQLKMLKRLIGENIDLLWKPASALWTIKADPAQIDQVLTNLCVNARDAITGIGRITVKTENCFLDGNYCEAHRGCVPGEYVLISVGDTGCGIDKQIVEHIFEPFFTTKSVGKGTGLGLAMVYGAVKQNHGFVDVSSETDQGTVFTIYLPRYLAAGTTAQKVGEGLVVPAEGGRETILLVEDEPSILKMTTRMLERLGYSVLTASTSGEAIRLAATPEVKIHLLITDVIMPEMNGRDLAERLVSMNKGLKCLFMSGYTSEIIDNQGLLVEGKHFIQKPFSKNGLATKIREMLD